jgi:hypothetical protein
LDMVRDIYPVNFSRRFRKVWSGKRSFPERNVLPESSVVGGICGVA